MSGFLIGAALAAAVAAFFYWNARKHAGTKRRLLSVETSTTGEVRSLAEAATQAAGPGAFAQLVELTGTTAPGPLGLLTSPLSDTPCLWHQHQVIRRYRDVRYDNEGRRRVSTKEEKMTNSRSSEAFVLRDATGEIAILPRGVQGARQTVRRFEETREGEQRTTLKVGSFSLDLPAGRRDDDQTLGYEYREWVLLPDVRIFVQGEATDQGGTLEVRKPRGDEPMMISTRSEADMIDAAESGRKQGQLFAAVAAGVAVVLLVVGIVVGLV